MRSAIRGTVDVIRGLPFAGIIRQVAWRTTTTAPYSCVRGDGGASCGRKANGRE